MADPKSIENQHELFEEFSGHSKKTERFASIAKTQKPILLSTNLEQLILVGIVSILICCVIFFLGVLRGKVIANADSRALWPSSNNVSRNQVELPSQPASTVTHYQVVQSATPISQVTQAPQATRVFSTSEAKSPGLPQKIAPPVELDPSKPYTIQLVTHKKKEIAENEVRSLRRGGHVSWIIPSGDYYQVCVGQYRNKDEAKKDLKFFSSRHRDCFLRRR